MSWASSEAEVMPGLPSPRVGGKDRCGGGSEPHSSAYEAQKYTRSVLSCSAPNVRPVRRPDDDSNTQAQLQ